MPGRQGCHAAREGRGGSSKCQLQERQPNAVSKKDKQNFKKDMQTSRKAARIASLASVHKNTETQDTRTHVDCVFKHLASKRDGTVNADAVVIHTAAASEVTKNTVAHNFYISHFKSSANRAQYSHICYHGGVTVMCPARGQEDASK